MRLIDADALREKAHKLPNGYNHGWFHKCVDEMIDTAPTIDPVRNGKWTYDDECNTGIYAICSACGKSVYQAGEWLYCPMCGAKMEDADA